MSTSLRVVPLHYEGPGRRAAPSAWAVVVALTLTVGRLVFVPLIVLAALRHDGVLASVLVLAFVIVDLFDGIVARALGVESPLRRALDGIVDKVSVHIVALVVSLMIPGAVWFWLVMLVRDLTQGAVGLHVLRTRRVVAAGAKWHRSFTLMVALWGSAMLISGTVALPLAIGMTVVGAWTLIDYVRQCFALDSAPKVKDSAVDAGVDLPAAGESDRGGLCGGSLAQGQIPAMH